MLVEAKLIDDAQLKKAEDMQKILGGKLGTIIVKLGFITDEALTKFLAKQENLTITDLTQIVIPRALVESIPRDILEKHQAVPVQTKGEILTLAVSDPTDFDAIEEIEFLTNRRVEITLASRAQVAKSLNEFFYGEGEAPPREVPEKKKEPVDSPVTPPTIGPGLEKALIPLLVEKGIITLEELQKKADALGEKD
ncbi:MAG: GspE/PulE/PilB domain-containing protein [Planctomycetota bacterium]|jgi:type II secretory ATPase GspE/PulE/Tfp pilus assembly ATPase PilB-like protein